MIADGRERRLDAAVARTRRDDDADVSHSKSSCWSSLSAGTSRASRRPTSSSFRSGDNPEPGFFSVMSVSVRTVPAARSRRRAKLRVKKIAHPLERFRGLRLVDGRRQRLGDDRDSFDKLLQLVTVTEATTSGPNIRRLSVT